MAQKTEKLAEETAEKLRTLQTDINDSVASIGSVYLRMRDLNSEIKKLEELKKSMEDVFDSKNEELTAELKKIEEQYPIGEIDLIEGAITFESAE
jgi:phage host-nuclease inhibitor protein Gam